MSAWSILLLSLAVLTAIWLLAELAMRLAPMPLDFYSSISPERAHEMQEEIGVQANKGAGWVHLAWTADPRHETYRVEKLQDGNWMLEARVKYGSHLVYTTQESTYRVWAYPKDGASRRLLGEVRIAPEKSSLPVYIPTIRSTWKTLFKPALHGNYINDHALYQDTKGDWRLVGITSKTDGNFNAERYFAVGRCSIFPPENGMEEEQPVADFSDLAWAPHIIKNAGTYHMFWSPHKLHQMESEDGIHWKGHHISMPTPHHRYFRDGMVLQVAENQWLLFATGRGLFFSRVDIYQSFNLKEWQYIRPALLNSWGSERNSAYASTESPTVTLYKGRYYLSVTFNNETPVLFGLLLLFKKWPGKQSYNDTRVFHSESPYDFGVHRGKHHSPRLLTTLTAHAPVWIYVAGEDSWYITTCGWPWVSTLTGGEVAYAKLEFLPVEGNSDVTVPDR